MGSAVFYGLVCWGNNGTVKDCIKLDKLIRKCAFVLAEGVLLWNEEQDAGYPQCPAQQVGY